MSEQAVKEWPEVEFARFENGAMDWLDTGFEWRAAEAAQRAGEQVEYCRYVPQQRVNALVEALVDRLRDEARHAEQRSSAHRSHDEHMGAEEASGRAAAFSVSADLLAALANYKEGEA